MTLREEVEIAREKWDREYLNRIADELEEMVGEAELWRITRVGFSIDELADTLDFLTKELDL